MKLGLELEFWVVDKKGRLDHAKPISQRVYFASQEFSKSMIEIQTEPHEDLNELLKEAISKTEILIELAKKDGKRIVPLGTPLNSGKVEIYESERFKIEEEVIGPEVKHAGRTAGLHIHFEKQNTLDQLNTLIALDPVSSLLNSSPYYQGKPIANSSRNKIYRNKACGAFPEQRQLWSYKNSIEEWEDKRSKLFQKFQQKAREKGISAERLHTHFKPENTVWTPVKLREDYPTVEWRAPDISLLSETFKLLKQIEPIIEENQISNNLPDFKTVKEASKEAIDHGLNSEKVLDYLKTIDIDPKVFSPLSDRIDFSDEISRKKSRKVRLQMAEELSKDLETAKKMTNQ